MDTIGGRTARGGVVTMASHGIKFAVSILATAVMARLLSPQDYGLIGMVAVATNFIVMFKDLGLSLATVQKKEISAKQISTLFWINLSLSVVTMLKLKLIQNSVLICFALISFFWTVASDKPRSLNMTMKFVATATMPIRP